MKKNTLLVSLSVLALSLGTIAQAQEATTPAPVSTAAPVNAATPTDPAQSANPFDKVPVTGTLADGSKFDGFLTVTKLAMNEAGKLVASGTLTGTAQGVGGTEATPVEQEVTEVPAEVKAPSGQCDVVNLDLGALDLDALGALVNLAPVDLDVIGDASSGKLLGNLLCTVAHLLDNPLGGLLDLGNILGKVNEVLGGKGGLLGGLLGGGEAGAAGGAGGLLGGLLGGGTEEAGAASGAGGLLGGVLGGGTEEAGAASGAGGLLGGVLGGGSTGATN